MDPDSLKFVDFLIEGGVFRILGRVKNYVLVVNDALAFVSESSDWANSHVLWIMLMWYEYIVYNFELYMIPFALMVYVLFRLVASDEFNLGLDSLDVAALPLPQQTPEISNYVFQPAKAVGVDPKLLQIPTTGQESSPSPSDMHPLYKLQALMEMVQVVQSILPVVKSVQAQFARLAELMDLKPISWQCCKILAGVTLWVYFLGLRYLLMGGGVLAFIKMHPCTSKAKIMLFKLIIKLKLLDALPSEKFGRIKAYIEAAIDETRSSHENISLAEEALSLIGVPIPKVSNLMPDLSVSDVDNRKADTEALINGIVSTIYSEPISFTASEPKQELVNESQSLENQLRLRTKARRTD